MGLGLAFLFDGKLEAKIQSLVEFMAGSELNSNLADEGKRPHLSLALFDQADNKALIKMAEDCFDGLSALDISFQSVGMFAHQKKIVYLAAVPTIKLLQVHRNIHREIEKADIDTREFYLPAQWIPHCTAAYDLQEKKFMDALTTCVNSGFPYRGRLEKLAVMEFEPVNIIAEFELKG